MRINFFHTAAALTCMLLSSVFSKSFSQEVNKIGVHLELGYSTEITDKGDNVGGFMFFVTPSYKIGENITAGIGTGAKVFTTLQITNDKEFIETRDKRHLSIPLYVNAMYKFKVHKTTPFVECKLGYSFLNSYSSWRSYRIFPEHQESVDIEGNLKGGAFFSPSIGVLFPTYNKQYFSLSLAYILERYSTKANLIQLNQVVKNSDSDHLVALKIGYVF